MNYLYITSGTSDFLLKLLKKHEDQNLSILFSSRDTLLLHETDGKSIFQMPRKFEIFDSIGEVPKKGFALFHYIPIFEDHKPVFEHRLMNRPKIVENTHGFKALRVLRQIKNDKYLIITCWEDEISMNSWKQNKTFIDFIEKLKESEFLSVQMYAGSSYLTEYMIGTKDDNQ